MIQPWHVVLLLVLLPGYGYLVSLLMSRGWHRGKITEAIRATRDAHNRSKEVSA